MGVALPQMPVAEFILSSVEGLSRHDRISLR
jgi:hypothetical protein